MNQSHNPESSRAARPSLTALVKEEALRSAWRRDKGRDLKPLLRLVPFVRGHPLDAILGKLDASECELLALVDWSS